MHTVKPQVARVNGTASGCGPRVQRTNARRPMVAMALRRPQQSWCRIHRLPERWLIKKTLRPRCTAECCCRREGQGEGNRWLPAGQLRQAGKIVKATLLASEGKRHKIAAEEAPVNRTAAGRLLWPLLNKNLVLLVSQDVRMHGGEDGVGKFLHLLRDAG